MQPNTATIDDDSINELNKLLYSIKTQKGLTRDEDLASELGYNDGYFAQVKSRGKAPKKLLDTLRLYYTNLQNAKNSKDEKDLKGGQPDYYIVINRMMDSMEKLVESRLIDSKSRDRDSETMSRLVYMLEVKLGVSDPIGIHPATQAGGIWEDAMKEAPRAEASKR